MTPLLQFVATRLRLAAALLSSLLLAACATQQGVPGSNPEPVLPPWVETPQEPAVQPPLLPPVTPLPPTKPPADYPRTLGASGAGPAVLALARQAQESRAAGRHEAALGQWQRALRIEPRNAFIWQSIAETHLFLKNFEQAENAAQKSTSLGRGNPWLDAGNWRLIAAARTGNGDAAGAQAASIRAATLSSSLTSTP